jgi:hypothetical protein
MSFTVRTRGNNATVTATCNDGAVHRFTISIDGTITNSHHEADEDSIIVALGGEPSACGKAVQVYQAARDTYNAYAGIADVPGIRWSRRRGWHVNSQEATCPDTYCGSRNALTHSSSVSHLIFSRGIARSTEDPNTRLILNAGATFNRWLHRNLGTAQPYATLGEMMRAHNITVGRHHTRMRINRSVITRQFVDNAVRIVGANPIRVLSLRDNGISLGWLTKLVAELNPRTLRKVRAHENIETALQGARNVDPVIVAGFLKAGVYSHLHTYARSHARPSQVLTVYRATNGRQTLADLIEEGMSVHEAIASVTC